MSLPFKGLNVKKGKTSSNFTLLYLCNRADIYTGIKLFLQF